MTQRPCCSPRSAVGATCRTRLSGSGSSALKSIGRPSVRIHDLRHFSGTQVARVANLRETMAHLGHSTPSASLRYQHLVSGRDAEIAESLSMLAESPAKDK